MLEIPSVVHGVSWGRIDIGRLEYRTKTGGVRASGVLDTAQSVKVPETSGIQPGLCRFCMCPDGRLGSHSRKARRDGNMRNIDKDLLSDYLKGGGRE